jgi:subtilisin family serine protease
MDGSGATRVEPSSCSFGLSDVGGRGSQAIRGLLWTAGSLVTVAIVAAVAAAGPARTCVRLWNAADNAVVRTTVATGGYRFASITGYTVDGPGRLCYVTVFDRTGSPDRTFVIWPDNLFDNGSLHDYSPYDKEAGYLDHALAMDPSLSISDDGRIET